MTTTTTTTTTTAAATMMTDDDSDVGFRDGMGSWEYIARVYGFGSGVEGVDVLHSLEFWTQFRTVP